jgi:hypothetical protein
MVKKWIIFLVKIIILFSIINLTNTTISNAGTLDDIFKVGDNFISQGATAGSDSLDTTKLNDASSSIFNILLTIGIIVILIVGVILGIQFMVASTEGKAELKQALIPDIVASAVILGAFVIWKLFVVIFSQI